MAKKEKDKVKELLSSVTKYLKDSGKLEKLDSYALESLEKAYKTFLLAEQDIESNGILTSNRFGDKIPNPSIKISNDARIQINKLLENMDLTHKQRYKKVTDTEEATEFENFLNEN